MAKDAKGHGSDGRGGSTFDRLNAARKSQGYKPMSESRRGVHNFLDYMAGDGPKPDVMVAAELANNHPKSDTVPVHPGASGSITGGQMDAYLRFARGFKGSGAVKEPRKKNIGSES